MGPRDATLSTMEPSHQPPDKVRVPVWGVPHPLCFLSHWALTVSGHQGRLNRLEVQAGVASSPPGETGQGFHGAFRGGCDSENGREPWNRVLPGFPAFPCKHTFTFEGQPRAISGNFPQHIGIRIKIHEGHPLVISDIPLEPNTKLP